MDYGAPGGAFAGGGFVQASPGDGGGGASQRGGGGGGGKTTRSEAVVPVTVKALSEAITASSEDTMMLWGSELGNVTLVAKVVSSSDAATQVTFVLDDGTGRATAKMWVEDDPEAAAALKKDLQPGSYVRAFGSLRAFQGSRTLVVYSVRAVTDFNEITFHALEVVYVNKQLTLQNGGGVAARGAKPEYAGGAIPAANAPYGAYAAPAPAHGLAVSGDVTADVAKAFEHPSARGESGASLAAVAQQLGGRYNDHEIRQAVERLVNDGLLYSTVDDQHYKSTAF